MITASIIQLVLWTFNILHPEIFQKLTT